MKIDIRKLKIGDFVKVKEGIKDPDFESQLMDNWQGKVIGIQTADNLVEIEWDVETLLSTPEKYLRKLIKEGYDYETMTLEVSVLERANRSDHSNQRKDAMSTLDAKLYWVELFEEEEKSIKYGKLFHGINRDNYNEIYKRWAAYLSENLTFPIETIVVEAERGRIKNGAQIKLLAIDDYDDMYGILGIGKYAREAVSYPICNLEAIDKKSKNYELLRDYVIWFANM